MQLSANLFSFEPFWTLTIITPCIIRTASFRCFGFIDQTFQRISGKYCFDPTWFNGRAIMSLIFTLVDVDTATAVTVVTVAFMLVARSALTTVWSGQICAIQSISWAHVETTLVNVHTFVELLLISTDTATFIWPLMPSFRYFTAFINKKRLKTLLAYYRRLYPAWWCHWSCTALLDIRRYLCSVLESSLRGSWLTLTLACSRICEAFSAFTSIGPVVVNALRSRYQTIIKLRIVFPTFPLHCRNRLHFPQSTHLYLGIHHLWMWSRKHSCRERNQLYFGIDQFHHTNVIQLIGFSTFQY